MRKIYSLILLLCLSCFVEGQDVQHAKYVMNKLCSPDFYGRGYTNGGIDSAAAFLSSEYSKIGLKPLTADYFQPFSISTNVISRAHVKIGDVELIPGEEFVVDNHCKSVSGTYKCHYVDEKVMKSDSRQKKLQKMTKNKAVIVDLREISDEKERLKYLRAAYSDFFNAKAYVLIDTTELVYGVSLSRKLTDYCVIFVKTDRIPKKKIKKICIDIENNYLDSYPVKNVVGFLQGREYPDSFVVVSAHYDHVGMMDSALFPGGNDNASGVAMMLDLANNVGNARFRPKYSLIFTAFASEETGLKGSLYMSENSLFDLKRVKFMLNLDMVGTGSDGITVVNGSVYKNEFSLLERLNGEMDKPLKKIVARGEACNSDHCPFYQKGVPAFFIYTIGKEYLKYHSVYDRAEDVPLTSYSELYQLVENFLYSL